MEDLSAGNAWEEHRNQWGGMGGRKMDLKTLRDTTPRDWPEGAGKIFLGILRDDQADESNRLLAAEPAGDFTVINNELANGLLSIVCNGNESEELRGKAVISLGPALTSEEIEKPLLLAAIDAAAIIRPLEASEILVGLTKSDDKDMAAAGYEAMAMAEAFADEDWDEDHDGEFLH